jgi:outer membrane lipoprotein SlyB
MLIGGLIAALALPGAADAATRCRTSNNDNAAAGTIVGALAGGLLGNAVSRGGGRTGGTVIGAVGGAIIGNKLASGSDRHCPDGYEAYDDDERGSDRAARDNQWRRQQSRERDDGRVSWRDQRGRDCHWRDHVDEDDRHSWIEVCR